MVQGMLRTMNSQINKPAANCIILVLCMVCYLNSLDCDLVHDDVFAIKENPDLRSEALLSSLLRNDFWGKPMADNTSHKSYRPLTVLTFKMNYLIHGLSPFGYHLANVILHITVSLMFLEFCQANIFHDQNFSLATTAIFAVHPIHTEAVTGVVGRADILACLLFLSSINFFLSTIKQDKLLVSGFNNNKPTNAMGQSGKYFIVSIALACMAMLCKENGITVIGVCIFIDVLYHKDELLSFISKRLDREKVEKLKRMFFRIFILIVTALTLLIFRLHIMNGQLPAFNEEDNPTSFAPHMSTRFMTYCYLCVFNMWLLLYPHRLSYDWQIGSIPLVETVADIRNLFSFVFFLSIFVLALRTLLWDKKGKSQNVILTGLALICFPFLPASNLFFRVGFVVAERILYIPSLGYCILVGHGLYNLLNLTNGQTNERRESQESSTHIDQSSGSNNSKFRKFLTVGFVLVIVVLMSRTIRRNRVWKDREALFRSGVEILPHNAKAHYNYANFLKDNERFDQAIYHYREAVRLYPKHASSHNNLATLLGYSEEAEYHFKQTLKHNPYHYKAMYNLAHLFRKKKRNAEAKILLENSLRINPEYLDATQVLAETFNDLGESEKGRELFHRASLKTTDADFFNNYGVFLANIGDDENSLRAYERSLELRPSHKVSLTNYGRQLKNMGRYGDAEKTYRRALEFGRDAKTLHLLGVLLYQTRRLKESELAFLEALKYEPHNVDYIRNHATAVFEQGQENEAITFLKNSLKHLPKSAVIIKVMANFLMSMRRQKEALDAITSGLAFNMNDPELHYMRANALRELKNLKLALQSYKDVVALDPKHFSALQNMGVIYHLQGFKIEAKHYYDKALELDPTNKVLRDNIAKLLRTM